MRPDHDPIYLTPDERLREVARTLAVGMLRLRARTAFPADLGEHGAPEKTPESGPNGLEVPGETVLSVHTG